MGTTWTCPKCGWLHVNDHRTDRCGSPECDPEGWDRLRKAEDPTDAD